MREIQRGEQSTKSITRNTHPRNVCRCCGGTGVNVVSYGEYKLEETCRFCNDGVAKWLCNDCGEVLPCCACFDRGGFRRPVDDPREGGVDHQRTPSEDAAL